MTNPIDLQNFLDAYGHDSFMGDRLETEKLVRKLYADIITQIVDKGASVSQEDAQFIRKTGSALTLRGIAIDTIFNPPPREENSSDRNGPSICVYDGTGNLTLANDAYISLVGLTSADEARELVHQGKLIDRIYSPKVAAEVRTFVASIDNNGGYRGKTFPLANGNAIRWTSLSRGLGGGTVRTGEDVSGIKNIPEPLDIKDLEGIPFYFTSLVQNFRGRIEKIISLPNDTRILMEELDHIAQIGDIIVDEGPFLIVIKRGAEFITMNKSYIASTGGYSVAELKENPPLYVGSQEEQVNAYIGSLEKSKHYCASFRMKKKDGDFSDLSFDTSRIAGTGPTMTTLRIGSMIESAEQEQAEEELRRLLES